MLTEKQIIYREVFRKIEDAIKLLESINETDRSLNYFKSEAIELLEEAHATLE